MSKHSSSLSMSPLFCCPRPFPIFALFLSLLMATLSVRSSFAGSYESPELSSTELQSGKRMSPYVSYQPWSYMKRAPGTPLIRFGKRSGPDEWEEVAAMRNIRAALTDPLIRFGKRMPANAPLIRFGRRPADGAPLIRFGKRAAMAPVWAGEEE